QPTPEPWPADVIAKYRTVGGATVDLYHLDTDKAHATCLGCGEGWFPDTPQYLRRQLQEHSAQCRAIPRPETPR
ncbi:hypothetical protein, partial [Streptomyces antibioticus]|uniref:hypothetical protein n=1 Tax=Streptomyces antibioticus TaxID=1890 RepID=UPI003405CEC2